MREPFGGAQHDAVEEPVVDVTQTHYRFTRQPVKYYRHHNPLTRLHSPASASSQPGPPTDDRLSASPEAVTQRPHHLFAQSDRIRVDVAASGPRAGEPLSPQEVVKFMLGLDATFTSAATDTPPSTTWSPLGATDRSRVDRTMTRPLSQAPNNPASPAHKILSGLKLRRSHSGKDEQLFV